MLTNNLVNQLDEGAFEPVKGQRIAQIVIYAVPNWQLVRGEVQDLRAERDDLGFGSSGL